MTVSPWVVKPNLVTEAARKATRLFPGVIGEVLSREIASLHEFTWLGEGSLPARLLTAVLELDESVVEVDTRWAKGGDTHGPL